MALTQLDIGARFKRRAVRTDDAANPTPEIRPASVLGPGVTRGVSFCKLRCVRLRW
jgi:hypothetical protein